MNYTELKNKMQASGFKFENYGKFITKDGRVYAGCGNQTSKISAAYAALDAYARHNNIYIWTSNGNADWSKIIGE